MAQPCDNGYEAHNNQENTTVKWKGRDDNMKGVCHARGWVEETPAMHDYCL